MSFLELPLTYNERQVIELVFRGDQVSRADLAALTGLTGATMSRLVTRLVDLGLLSESVDRSGTIGQPRRHLSIAPGKAYSVGVNFMWHRFDVALVDLAGKVVAYDVFDIDAVTPDSLADCARSSVDALLKRSRVRRNRLIGAGISVPGNFAPDGVSLRAHDYFRALDDINLVPVFEQALDTACAVDTDGACAAIGEFLHGEGRAYDTFYFIHLGHGVGGGTIIGRRLYRGPHGNAAKSGVLFPYDQPRPSGQDLIQTLRAAGAQVRDIVDIETVMGNYKEAVDAWIDRSATQLCEVMRVVTAFIDPEIIVLGGRLPSELNRRLVGLIQQAKLVGPSRGIPVASVIASKLGPKSGALGAASLPVFANFFPGSVGSRHNAYADGRRNDAGPLVQA